MGKVPEQISRKQISLREQTARWDRGPVFTNRLLLLFSPPFSIF
jgi:hypothetical protein